MTRGRWRCLVDAQVVLLVEARRVAGVADDERCTVEVHAALLATDEQVRALTQRGRAVDVGRGEAGGSVGRACVDLEAVVGARDAGGKFWSEFFIVFSAG